MVESSEGRENSEYKGLSDCSKCNKGWKMYLAAGYPLWLQHIFEDEMVLSSF